MAHLKCQQLRLLRCSYCCLLAEAPVTSHWHQLKRRLIQDPPIPPPMPSHTQHHTSSAYSWPQHQCCYPRLTPFSTCNNVHVFRLTPGYLHSNNIMRHTRMQIGLLLKRIHASTRCYGQSESLARISRLAFDLVAEQTTPILNTRPETCWASLPKPIACPPLFMAPACLLISHSHNLHLYCSAASLTWDNEKTKNVITLT